MNNDSQKIIKLYIKACEIKEEIIKLLREIVILRKEINEKDKKQK